MALRKSHMAKDSRAIFTCLSSDTKPTETTHPNLRVWDIAIETDTGNKYEYRGSTAGWVNTDIIGAAIVATSAPTENGRTARDTFTGTGNGTAFSLSRLPANIGIYSSADHSGTTSVKLQYSPDGAGAVWVDADTSFTVTGASTSNMFATTTAPCLMRFVCTSFGAAGTVYSYTEE